MFLSRRHRPNKWPFYVLIGIEFPLTVALLALFGIAAPNTYRTKLWQDGADNGFNSSPVTGLYAHANYRPFTTPKVWTPFITNFNVVIVVLSMFLMLCKGVMYMLHVWPPILSACVHAVLIALYTTSLYYQASPDNSDPEHPSNGPVWYITKSCGVAHNPKNVHYCTQAKSAFAATCVALAIFVVYFGLAIWSCFPSRAQREEYAERKRAREEKWSRLEAQHEEAMAAQTAAMPDTPGPQQALNPMTPRTMAFNALGGTKDRDLPLRNHFSSPNAPTSPTYQIRSPTLPRSPLNMGFEEPARTPRSPPPQPQAAAPRSPPPQSTPRSPPPPSGPAEEREAPKMYFPPPPKSSSKSKN